MSYHHKLLPKWLQSFTWSLCPNFSHSSQFFGNVGLLLSSSLLLLLLFLCWSISLTSVSTIFIHMRFSFSFTPLPCRIPRLLQFCLLAAHGATEFYCTHCFTLNVLIQIRLCHKSICHVFYPHHSHSLLHRHIHMHTYMHLQKHIFITSATLSGKISWLLLRWIAIVRFPTPMNNPFIRHKI